MYDEFGYLMADPWELMKKNLVGRKAAIELLFFIPWDLIPLILAINSGSCPNYGLTNSISYHRVWAFVRLPKLIPCLVHLSDLLQEMYIPKVSTQMGRLVKSIMALVYILHLSSCFFFSLSFAQNSKNSWVWKNNLVNANNSMALAEQYILSFKAAKSAFVFETRKCYTDIEWVYSIFELAFAAVVYGCFFGMINSILKASMDRETINRKKEYKYRLSQIKELMIRRKFTPQMQDEVLRHEQAQFRHMNGLNQSRLFSDLPKDVQIKIVNSL
jgi:hypothetical protein